MTPLRSALYLPADRASAVAKARRADCDAVILDLEDAVAPDAKDEARDAAVEAVREGGFGNRKLVVRTNPLDTEWGKADLAVLSECGAPVVLLPKITRTDELATARSHIPVGTSLWAMIETCEAILNLGSIASEAKIHGLTTFVLGTNDLALEMRCKLDTERSAMLSLLTQTVVAARAHDLAVVDGVFNDLADEEGFAAQCAQGAAMGFDGKTVIHPCQLAAANAAFGPSGDAIEQARSLVAAFAAPENAGKGVIKHEGRMAELLHLRAAERTLGQAGAIARRAN